MKRMYLGKAAAIFAMLGAMLGQSAQAAVSIDNTTLESKKKIANIGRGIQIGHAKSRSLLSGNVASPYKHHRKAGYNQRQLRKHLRSNPWQRKKYGK